MLPSDLGFDFLSDSCVLRSYGSWKLMGNVFWTSKVVNRRAVNGHLIMVTEQTIFGIYFLISGWVSYHLVYSHLKWCWTVIRPVLRGFIPVLSDKFKDSIFWYLSMVLNIYWSSPPIHQCSHEFSQRVPLLVTLDNGLGTADSSTHLTLSWT